MREPQGDRAPPATAASLATRLSPATAWTAGPAARAGSLPCWRLLGRASPVLNAPDSRLDRMSWNTLCFEALLPQTFPAAGAGAVPSTLGDRGDPSTPGHRWELPPRGTDGTWHHGARVGARLSPSSAAEFKIWLSPAGCPQGTCSPCHMPGPLHSLPAPQWLQETLPKSEPLVLIVPSGKGLE